MLHRSCAAFVVALTLLMSGMTAQALEPPALLLAERYVGGIDVSAYWVSEKLDGVRAAWDGKQLRFRSGNAIVAPDWFIEALPAQALDGELWMGRGTFDRLSAAVRRKSPDDAEWRQIRYMIFELPDAPADFTGRVAQAEALIARSGVPWLQPVRQFRLADARALQNKLAEVLRGGGEGLMLHRADAPYVTGRSSVLLKVTPWLDAEARVVAHLPGKGKYSGMLGALQLEMPNGRTFAIGSGFSVAERRHPPTVGAQVTYRYRELTRNGIPRFPRFVRVREPF